MPLAKRICLIAIFIFLLPVFVLVLIYAFIEGEKEGIGIARESITACLRNIREVATTAPP